MTENELSNKIIGASIEIHKTLGPGLLESAYKMALFYDLQQMGLEVKRQVAMPFKYKEINLEIGYRIDILVESKVIIELKAVENLTPTHFAQTLTYLKLSNLKLGLLLNFNEKYLKHGIQRVANGL
ncbi:GxxExxY protein [Frigoriflavimonas asaccharolytica]|uniref:GxxExxY protein n=1 Tax=Frigoriflavimonas asaccharolytica TaxID=2735899 RepID=A0A8J8G8Z5_9FLAO|nr:GxxExxY protein [Frigoriflavimonas asaccharolytica]NRS93658.1 GxxExxY protein [Frigoriflavimonas asaccharolytica]